MISTMINILSISIRMAMQRFLLLLTLVFGILVIFSCKPAPFEASIFERYKLVGHAFGGVDGRTYTNSFEAFHENFCYR
jgi:hypothetical protein